MSTDEVDTVPKPTPGQTRIVNVNDMPWQETGSPGIKMKILYHDKVTGGGTALLKFEPGAKTPLHEHTGLEQTFVIQGSLVDHDGEVVAGNYACRMAGTVHQAHSPHGSLHISFFSSANKMLDGAEDRLFTEPPEGGK